MIMDKYTRKKVINLVEENNHFSMSIMEGDLIFYNSICT